MNTLSDMYCRFEHIMQTAKVVHKATTPKQRIYDYTFYWSDTTGPYIFSILSLVSQLNERSVLSWNAFSEYLIVRVRISIHSKTAFVIYLKNCFHRLSTGWCLHHVDDDDNRLHFKYSFQSELGFVAGVLNYIIQLRTGIYINHGLLFVSVNASEHKKLISAGICL